MLTYVYTLSHLIYIIWVSCITSPVNWNQCIRVHEWIPPYIQDYKDFKSIPPYSLEKNGVRIREEYERLQRDLQPDSNGSKLVPGLLQK